MADTEHRDPSGRERPLITETDGAPSILSQPLVPDIDLSRYLARLTAEPSVPGAMRGRVRHITGMIIKARLPNARLGEICTIEPAGRPPVAAQVVGFDDEDVFLTALDPLDQVGPKTPVINRGKTLRVPVGNALLGRVDVLGTPAIIQWISPIIGFVFLLLTIQVWRIGVRHYTSTGS